MNIDLDALQERLKQYKGDTFGIGTNKLEALIDRLRKAEAASKWQPIETAPKDGTTVQVHSSRWLEPCSASFSSREYFEKEYGDPEHMEEGWYPSCGFLFDLPEITIKPTHWMPLPAAPDSVESEGEKG